MSYTLCVDGGIQYSWKHTPTKERNKCPDKSVCSEPAVHEHLVRLRVIDWRVVRLKHPNQPNVNMTALNSTTHHSRGYLLEKVKRYSIECTEIGVVPREEHVGIVTIENHVHGCEHS
jgi:hypothetical protein